MPKKKKGLFSRLTDFFFSRSENKEVQSQESSSSDFYGKSTDDYPAYETNPESVSKAKQSLNDRYGYSSELQTLKERLQPIIDEANSRWARLDSLDLRSLAVSRALEETNGTWGFDVSRLTTREQVIEEATRARVFLSDRTSTIQGAELYTQQESAKQYIGQFGNQYNNWEHKFKRFNTATISEDEARIAFSAYRRLEESEQARIMQYGSENMIIAIYDMIIQNGYGEDYVQDVTEMARDLLDRELGVKHQQFEKAFKEANEVGNILDIVLAEDDYLNRGTW